MADPPLVTSDDVAEWFNSQVPDGWFGNLRALVDRDEIMVIGTLQVDEAAHEQGNEDEGVDEAASSEVSAIEWFREETRQQRVAIARRAEATFKRKVSWATECGSTTAAFTHLSVPVMTRLRINERRTLDTLVAAGAARSRSDALGWCVRLVVEHEREWLDELSEAIDAVNKVRAQGPG